MKSKQVHSFLWGSVRMSSLVSFVLLIAVICSSTCSNAELFTATAEMKALYETEKVIVQVLSDYLHAEQQRLADLQRLINELSEHSANVGQGDPEFAFNPINLFLLIKHFAVNFAQQKQEVTSTASLNVLKDRLDALRESLPTEEDLDGAVSALIRLQDTYALPAARMASGSFPQLNQAPQIPTTYAAHKNLTSQALTAADCLTIVRVLYERSDFQNAVNWALEALERDSGEPNGAKTADRRAILDYLAFSAFETGRIGEARRFNEQIIALADPVDAEESGDSLLQRALNNKAYFDQLSSDEEQQLSEQRKQADKERRATDAYRQSQEFERYKQLCRGDVHVKKAAKKNSRLYCDLHTNGNMPYWLIGPIRRELLSLDPLIVLFHNALSDAECESVRQLATPRLHRALVHNPVTGKLETAHYRVAKNAWLKHDFNDFTRRLDQRIGLLTGLETSTAEELQVANYGLGGQYEPHFDFARHYETETFRDHAGNRIATLMFYLSDVVAGGTTVFTDLGTRAVPERGAAIFWFNLKRSGEGDYRTRHAACPVLVGSKWVANKWFHEGGQEFRRPCALSPDL